MSMCSHTLPDGRRETVTDFPYYTSLRKRTYYQHWDREGALDAAHDFAMYVQARYPQSTVEVHEVPERQHVLMTEHEPARERLPQ